MSTSTASPFSSIALPPVSIDPETQLPLLWEDEDYEMGESYIHVLTDEILHICLQAFFANQPEVQIFSNMNLYYTRHPDEKTAPYISPDLMAVRPAKAMQGDLPSYRIGTTGPAPFLVAEILSERSHQQRDLKEKLVIYAKLGVPEYIVIDVTGRYLPERLVLRQLQPDGTWSESQDPDGGVTSRCGFRLIIESDGQLRVIDAATGRKFLRPREGVDRAGELERRVHELEAELARLRSASKSN